MPRGVYIRTKELIKAFKKAQKIAWKLPRSQKQIEASRKNARKMSSNNNADTIVKHHNDLKHGAERPDDVAYMRMKDHRRLHAKLEYQNRQRDTKGKFIC